MRKTLRALITILLPLLIAAPLFVSPAAAQTHAPISDAEALAQFSALEVMTFRQQLDDILAKQREIIATAGGAEALQAFDGRTALLKKVSDADFARFMAMGVDLAPLQNETARVHVRIMDGQARAMAELGSVTSDSTNFPNATYSARCGSVRNSAEAMFDGAIVLEVAKTVHAGFSRACDQVVLGFNTSLLCIIADVILAAAEGVYNTFQFCDADIDSSELEASYDRLGHLHTDVEGAERAIINNDNSNRSAILDNATTNKSAIVGNDDSNREIILANMASGVTNINGQSTANTTTIVQNDDANATAIVQNDDANRSLVISNDNDNRDTIIAALSANSDVNRDILVAELRALACDIIRLLNTPEGQRSSDLNSCSAQPGYPYGFPEKKGTSSSSVSGIELKLTPPPVGRTPRREESVVMEAYLAEGRLLAAYYLPAAKGGLLEGVRDLVWNTIALQQELQLAPAETAVARAGALEADELLAAGRFIDAYRQYSVAYRSLIPR